MSFKYIFNLIIFTKNLKFSQIFHRLIKKHKRRAKLTTENANIRLQKNWVNVKSGYKIFDKNKIISILNIPTQLSHVDWSSPNKSDLYKYNLHYFNYLDYENIFSKHLILNWIDLNKNKFSIAWDPYPISLRIINWLKFLQKSKITNKKILNSIKQQSLYLKNNLELDVLANHYLVNLKALTFYACYFNDLKTKNEVTSLLEKEIKKQFLEDGEHYELSPMYHNIAVLDLLDIYNLLRFDSGTPYFSSELPILIKKAIKFSENINHSPKEFTFINDSCNNVAPDTTFLKNYAKDLDIELEDCANKFLKIYKQSGFCVIKNNDLKVIFAANPAAPNYQIGHTHADTLSIEISLKGKKIFTNAGISTYESNKKRENERSTTSKNTVTYGQKSSSYIISSFRMGKRANITNLEGLTSKNEFFITASHDGFSNIYERIVHTRSIKVNKTEITIIDYFNDSKANKISRLHLHPDVKISKDNKNLILGNNDKKIFSLKNENIEIANYSYNDSFNNTIESKVIKRKMGNQLKTLIKII